MDPTAALISLGSAVISGLLGAVVYQYKQREKIYADHAKSATDRLVEINTAYAVLKAEKDRETTELRTEIKRLTAVIFTLLRKGEANLVKVEAEIAEIKKQAPDGLDELLKG